MIQWVRLETYEDGYVNELVTDITAEVNRLLEEKEQLGKDLAAVRKDLQDIKNRGGWTELSIARDERSGLAAVVRTEYRLRAEHMRVEFDPHQYPAYLHAQNLSDESWAP